MPHRPRAFIAFTAAFAAAASPLSADGPLTPPTTAATGDALRTTLPQGSVTVELLPGGFVLVSPALHTPPQPVTDPRYHWRFSRSVWLYAPRREAGTTRRLPGLFRAVTLHHEPEDGPLARRTARLCARLLRLHYERFGRDAGFGPGVETAEVWLAPDRPPQDTMGGETRNGSIYVFATGSPRSRLEWTRTIAHEWGHLTLPAARGFTEPESDAAGYLGERLYLKWLREDEQAAAPSGMDDGCDRGDLDLYHRRQIAPLIERFQRTGPDTPLLQTSGGSDSMNLYIGAVLAADDALGSQTTGNALYAIADVRPRDFLDAVRAAGGTSLTVRLPAWVPLVKTDYEIAALSGTGSVAFADRPAFSLPALRLRVQVAGWKWVRAASGDLRSIRLRQTTTSSSSGVGE